MHSYKWIIPALASLIALTLATGALTQDAKPADKAKSHPPAADKPAAEKPSPDKPAPDKPALANDKSAAQDKPAAAAAPAGMPDMAEMMRKWQRVASPGQHHKPLNHFVGSWKTTTKMWMAGPAGPPTITTGTSEVKWVLDGRFLMEENSGEFMMPGPDGQMRKTPHQGIGMTGYDNFRNVYIATWADNMNTQILTMSGALDPSGKTLTLYGQMDEPMLDVIGRSVKYVTKIVDDNKHVFEIYDLHAGDGYKVIEVTYERK